MTDKKTLRKQFLKKRDALTGEERDKAEERLFEEITGLKEYREADNILLFYSYGSEISTIRLIDYSLQIGKTVYLPKIKNGEMIFFSIKDRRDTVPGFHGIPEPSEVCSGCAQYVFDRKNAGNTFMIMPGLIYDREGKRIGYGGGFYDRFLAANEGLNHAAIGFGCQVCDEMLPIEPFDRKPMRIICV